MPPLLPSTTPRPGAGGLLRRLLTWGVIAGLLLLAGGCASLPAQVGRPSSSTLVAAADSPLRRIAEASRFDEEQTGFRLLPSGVHALNARVELIRRARASLDLQYYHVQNDPVGRLVLRELRDAAARGVRVRLLVDDLYTADIDDLLLALAAHPGVEVRLFNPFAGGRHSLATRLLASFGDLSRVNHRMHNKLFIADGVMAVAGGRNLGGEYFMRADGANFLDLDAFMVGAALPRLAEVFDTYWNSLFVYPVGAVMPPAQPPEAQREYFELATASAAADALLEPPEDPLGYGPLADELDAGRVGLVWGRVEVHADPPDKIVGGTRAYGDVPLSDVVSVTHNVMEALRQAREEVLLVSPYLIPGPAGMEDMRRARAAGVRITLLTNSLATTDESLVHAGYRRYRKQMLEAGVELYEFSPLRIRRVQRLKLLGSSTFRLHTKSAVIDRRVVYLGSMNFDPRSAATNTEMGLIIESPELAREVARLGRLLQLEGANRVALDAHGRLVWHVLGEDGELTVDTEPDTGFWTRWMLELLSPLAIEELL